MRLLLRLHFPLLRLLLRVLLMLVKLRLDPCTRLLLLFFRLVDREARRAPVLNRGAAGCAAAAEAATSTPEPGLELVDTALQRRELLLLPLEL